jgi:hypothetical protein
MNPKNVLIMIYWSTFYAFSIGFCILLMFARSERTKVSFSGDGFTDLKGSLHPRCGSALCRCQLPHCRLVSLLGMYLLRILN